MEAEVITNASFILAQSHVMNELCFGLYLKYRTCWSSDFYSELLDLGQTKVAQRGCDPDILQGSKTPRMNVHSKK